MDAETWPKMMTIMQQQQQEKKKKKNDVQLQAMWFAAGTAVAMACLQRAIPMSFLEQWRMLVFLALNLLLLAILFTSTHNNLINSISSTTDGGGGTRNGVEVDVVNEEKKWKKQTGVSSASADPPPPAADEHKKEDKSNTEDDRSETELLNCKISSKTENLIHIIKGTENHHLKKEDGETHHHHQDQDKYPEISMEELNKRAEAFIAMFRQHLLSDAKVANSFRLHPYSSSETKGGDEMFTPKNRAYRIA